MLSELNKRLPLSLTALIVDYVCDSQFKSQVLVKLAVRRRKRGRFWASCLFYLACWGSILVCLHGCPALGVGVFVGCCCCSPLSPCIAWTDIMENDALNAYQQAVADMNRLSVLEVLQELECE